MRVVAGTIVTVTDVDHGEFYVTAERFERAIEQITGDVNYNLNELREIVTEVTECDYSNATLTLLVAVICDCSIELDTISWGMAQR